MSGIDLQVLTLKSPLRCKQFSSTFFTFTVVYKRHEWPKVVKLVPIVKATIWGDASCLLSQPSVEIHYLPVTQRHMQIFTVRETLFVVYLCHFAIAMIIIGLRSSIIIQKETVKSITSLWLAQLTANHEVWNLFKV